MITKSQAAEAKGEFKSMRDQFNGLVGAVGLNETDMNYYVTACLTRAPTEDERKNLPSEHTTKSHITVPIKYRLTGLAYKQ